MPQASLLIQNHTEGNGVRGELYGNLVVRDAHHGAADRDHHAPAKSDLPVDFSASRRSGPLPNDEMKGRIRSVIRENTTPRHVPAKIVAVPEIPRTISGKIVELAVRNVVHDKPVKNTDALANPGALAHFRDIAELKTP